MKTYAQKKLVTKSWKQMLFFFNEIFLKTNSTLIVFSTNGFLVTAHTIFLMRTFRTCVMCLLLPKCYIPLLPIHLCLYQLVFICHSMTHIISIPYSSPKSWLTFNFMFTDLGKNIQKNFLPLKTITQQHFAYTISLCARCF